MKDKRITILLLLAVLLGMPEGTRAQNGFNIPFSQFGIGSSDLPYNMPSAMRLGGVVYSRAARNSINPFNPASFAAVEPETFVFDIGLNIQQSVLRNDVNKQTDADGNVAYLMVAFPLTKWWKTSAGILPYSSVNYESTHTAYDPLTQSDVKTIYAGNGGVAQIYWGNGFNIGKRLSVGFNLDYLYGSIERAITYDFQGSDSTYTIDSRRQKNTLVSNLVVDLGVQYSQPLGEKYTLRMGATARLPRDMKLEDQSLAYTFYSAGSLEYYFDTIFPAPGVSDTYESELLQPLAVGVGLALERNERWEVALDGYYSPYSGMKYVENSQNNIFGTSALRYGSNYRIALGGEWKGDQGSSSYWSRIGISAGLFYNSGRLSLELTDGTAYRLDEVGGGMGFTLPMRKGKSVLTLSLAYSSFGNVDLLRRDVFTVGISVGSCERWFSKRKYN